MKFTITLITLLLAVSAAGGSAVAQTPEQEILAIHASLDNAFLKKEIAVFEKVIAPDYVYSNPTGDKRDRAGNLAEIRKDFADTSYKTLGMTTEEPTVKVMGNTALVTAGWTYTSQGVAPGAEPHMDRGRYTGVYEKRNGNWMLVAEHFSEAPHDRKLMEQQVMKAGLEYVRIIKSRDAAALENLLADEYISTNERGETRDKAGDIASYKKGTTTIEAAELSDQKIRITGNGSAVETGTFRIKGTTDGKAFDSTERFTTVWVWRGGRWQVLADHVSVIKK